ncbi:MAG: outer membrane beta-barrel protein [Gemmatimonadales bacterium]
MKRFGLALIAVMALCVVAVRPATAQGISWGVGAGLLMPMSTYGDFDKLGFQGGLGGTYHLPGGIGIRADVSYGTTSEKSGVGDHSTKIAGGMASVVYAFGAAGPKPYVMGGLGLSNVKVSAGGTSVSETKVSFGFGAGVSLPLGTGGNRLFAETRYTSVSTSGQSTAFLPIVVGVSFGK